LAGSCVLGRVCTIDALYQEGKRNLKIMLAMKLSRTSRRSYAPSGYHKESERFRI
jgi:hypothetical protein